MLNTSYTLSIISLIVSILVIMYLPMAIYVLVKIGIFLTMRIKNWRPKSPRRFTFFNISPIIRKTYNKVIIEIVTNGENTESTLSIIERILSYKFKDPIYVLTEYYDNFNYGVPTIKVPKNYSTLKKSMKKMRALQYGIEILHDLGYGRDTYIIHLDDDSYVNEDYIQYVRTMTSPAGQGSVKLRDYTGNNLTGMLDTIRVSTCRIHCAYNNIKNKVKFVHGEGLVVRADIEYEMGWDYGLAGAEDLIMGYAISKKYWVDHIPYNIYVNPPTNIRDLFAQRARWLSHVLGAKRILRSMNPSLLLFYYLLYFYGILGIVAESLWIYDLATGTGINTVIFFFSLVNLISIALTYEIGAASTSRKYAVIVPFIFLFLGFIENITTIFALIKRPDARDFKVIYKMPATR